ncbi:unnamed protein product [Callosobruchus maculatus]|uniref:Uncharacterized protein n=1 Tax=Callosobruchus maculatus TaxID=64391 RepID=A0A653DG01_CALMS|nr:unnamed protein product [Callosobruchus maculatus]
MKVCSLHFNKGLTTQRGQILNLHKSFLLVQRVFQNVQEPHLIKLIDIKAEIEVHAQAKMKILKNVILKQVII